MNVTVSQLRPGVFGVCHGGGVSADIICAATQSSAGHAFLYLGGGLMVQGKPPAADIVPADSYSDAIWAWRMWDQLETAAGWSADRVSAAQAAVALRGHALAGTPYDWAAYAGIAAEILHLRAGREAAPDFTADTCRICSALVDDAEIAGGVPMTFVPGDGPGLFSDPGTKVALPPNLVTPGMLLGLAQRSEWI